MRRGFARTARFRRGKILAALGKKRRGDPANFWFNERQPVLFFVPTPTQKQIHGHDVIDMMLANPRPYTRLSLTRAIIERFGDDARFHTCTADDLTAAELVDFLADRQKFMPAGDGFIINPERVCKH